MTVAKVADGAVHGVAIEAPHSAGATAPRAPTPAGAVDCHMHVFDPRFPVVPGRSPPVATVAQYRRFQRRLGLSRCVVVAPSSYGFDNSCLLATLAEMGPSARGIASVPVHVPGAELDRLHACGVRGVRLNFGRIPGTSFDDASRLGTRLGRLGWHLQVNMHAPVLLEAGDVLSALPCPLVLDHLGHVPQPGGADHPAASVLRRLLDGGNTWVKLSGPYLHSVSGPPDYRDTLDLARLLARTAPERLVWGSDWPHTMAPDRPDGAALLDILSDWLPDAATRQRVLVENPHALYGLDRNASPNPKEEQPCPSVSAS